MKTELTVLHLSDLHFGDEEYFWSTPKVFSAAARPAHDRPTLAGTVINDLRDLQAKFSLWPDLVIVSGDLLDHASSQGIEPCISFLAELADALGLGRERVVLCPGNHDVDREMAETDPRQALAPYVAIWNAFYQPVSTLVPQLEGRAELWSRCRLFNCNDDLAVLSLNSCEALGNEHYRRHGYVGVKQLERAAKLLDNANLSPNTRRIAVLHHHLSQFHGAVGEDYSILVEVRRVLEWLRDHHFHLVVHGHQHRSGVDVLVLRQNALTIIAGGSTGVSAKWRADGSVPLQYQLLRFHQNGAGDRLPRKFNPVREEWEDNPDEKDRTLYDCCFQVPDLEPFPISAERGAARPPVELALPQSSPFHWRHQVHPSWFIDREEQMAAAIERIVQGNSISVVTPPRGGRSSFLAALAWRLKDQNGFERPVHVLDLQRSVMEGKTGLFRRLCGSLNGVGNTAEAVEQLLKKQPQPPVFFLDEFEVLTHETFTPPLVAVWLRSLINENLLTLVTATPEPLGKLFPDTPGSGLNLFRPMELPPFLWSAAEAMWKQYLAASEIPFDQAQKKAIFNWSQGHPCKLMIGSDHLYRALDSKSGSDWREPAHREWSEVFP